MDFQIYLYGGAAGLSLILGAAVGLIFKFKQTTIARFMAFGAGVLICALTFGLMEEAFGHGGFDAVIAGFLAGGMTYIVMDYFLHKIGARRHKHTQLLAAPQQDGRLITIGTVLDGIPESIALGISLFNGQGRGLLMLAAIVLSNFPESISSLTGLKREGYKKGKIYFIWGVVALVTLVVSVLSFTFLHDIDPNWIGFFEAFAAGAILAMLANSMMPEAYENGGFTIGILTILGFLVAFVLSRFK